MIDHTQKKMCMTGALIPLNDAIPECSVTFRTPRTLVVGVGQNLPMQNIAKGFMTDEPQH